LLRTDPERLPGRDALGLPLQLERRELPVLDDLLRGGEGPRAHHHPAGLRRSLQSRGHVHSVTGQHPIPWAGDSVLIDEHLPGLDADPHLESRLAFGREGPIELGEDRLHLQRGSDRTFGIILVGTRDAEDRQEGIAHKLLEQPLVTPDLIGQPVECPPHHGLDHLGILALSERRRPDQVGE
jgi:hypothetical protein